MMLNRGARPRHSHIWERDQNDHYVEPSYCSAALFAAERFGEPSDTIYDPACGWGRILRTAQEAGYDPIGSDIIDRPLRRKYVPDIEFRVRNFLVARLIAGVTSSVFNSPYEDDQIERFCTRACTISSLRVAAFIRLSRIRTLLPTISKLPLEKILLMHPRPSAPTGNSLLNGNKPRGDRQEYCWLIFDHRIPTGHRPYVERLDCDPQMRAHWEAIDAQMEGKSECRVRNHRTSSNDER